MPQPFDLHSDRRHCICSQRYDGRSEKIDPPVIIFYVTARSNRAMLPFSPGNAPRVRQGVPPPARQQQRAVADPPVSQSEISLLSASRCELVIVPTSHADQILQPV